MVVVGAATYRGAA